MLFELESVASTLGTATYTRTEEVTHEFFETEFLTLLRSIVSYLRSRQPEGMDTSAAENALSEVADFLGVEEDTA